MKRVSFAELPWTVRVVLGIATLNAWVTIEELVIDRLGLWRYLPGYRYAKYCIRDFAVTLAIVSAIWWLSARRTE